jgi:hypothetical protein
MLMKKLLLAGSLMLLFSSMSFSNETEFRKYGVFIPAPINSSEFYFRFYSFPLRYEPGISISTVTVDSINQTNLMIGLRVSANHLIKERFNLYPGLYYFSNVIFLQNQTYLDHIMGVLLGFEYLLSNHFGICSELGFNLSFADKEYSPSGYIFNSTSLYTSKKIGLAYYF